MCGIVGYISTKEKAYKDDKAHFMRFALALDTLRGRDSTGVMTISKKFDIDLIRTTMPGDRFVHSPKYKNSWVPGWAKVGHNRAATRGAVNLQNAHPFVDGPIVLVHNGTLWGDGCALPTFNTDLDVDSMQIAHALAQHEPGAAKEVLEAIDGSFALVWYDKRDESINMVRNAERPLSFGVNKDRDMMWFMSDAAHLQSINRSLGQRQAAATTIYQLDKHRHLKWRKGSLVPEVTEFDPFVFTKSNRSPNYSHTSQRSGAKQKEDSGTALDKATEKWKRAMEDRGNTPTKSDNGCEVKVRLGGTNRRVPGPMLQSLKEEYDLDPSDLIEFVPSAAVKFDNTNNMVLGKIIHRDWGDSEWSAVLYDAKTVQVNAYIDQSWLVRPIGLTQPWDDKTSCPGMLVKLVHCDWDSYAETLDEDPDEAADDPKVPGTDDSWIVGPGGVYQPFDRLKKPLESGCITCSMALEKDDLKDAMWVNNRQDILCSACCEDLKKDGGLAH